MVQEVLGSVMTAGTVSGLVSTIIPVHNRPELLKEAVASVLTQTYRPIEIIIVDDGSTDDTPEVAKKLSTQFPCEVVVVLQKNSGPGLAREAGRLRARGEFIQYLDSDDVLLPGKFASQVAGLMAEPDIGVAYGFTRYRHADGRIEPKPWKQSGTRYPSMFPTFLTSRWWDTPTPLYRATVCSAAGPWTDLRLEEDWEYDCRIASLNTKLYFCEMYVAEVRDHGNNRLCRGTALDPTRLASRARAHTLIFSHAKTAKIENTDPNMLHFSRALFFLSRQCGAAGLAKESKELFALARENPIQTRAQAFEFTVYSALANLIGWEIAGRISCSFDKIRH